MTRDELLAKLRELNARQDKRVTRKPYTDAEDDHHEADEALIEYINDEEIKAAYDALEKWYA